MLLFGNFKVLRDVRQVAINLKLGRCLKIAYHEIHRTHGKIIEIWTSCIYLNNRLHFSNQKIVPTVG
jgi:hypothetical protein